jgi:nitroimidazol reductase NimA-like FMN-containing flavoprotein (pyridoxamine 5'-phosphate oxidase superfamily)
VDVGTDPETTSGHRTSRFSRSISQFGHAPVHNRGVTTSGYTFEILDEAACDRLLRQQHLGRVGFVVDGEPLVLPVNFACMGGDVVFCTGVDTVLARATGGVAVAFEVDAADAQYHEGWSVLVRGHIEAVTDADEIARFAALPVRAWVPRERGQWLRIRRSAISGRRIRHS